jgi:hypothetical protein
MTKREDELADRVRVTFSIYTPKERAFIAFGLALARDSARKNSQRVFTVTPARVAGNVAAEIALCAQSIAMDNLMKILLENVDLDTIFPPGWAAGGFFSGD